MAGESAVIKLLVVRKKDEKFPYKQSSTGRKASMAVQYLQLQKRMISVLSGHHSLKGLFQISVQLQLGRGRGEAVLLVQGLG